VTGSCTVAYQVNQWSNGFTANLTITNRAAAISSWALTWTFGGNQQVTNAWNTELTQSGTGVTARNASYNGAIPTNGNVTFGFQATYSGTNNRPAEFRLNGTVCTNV
jgi:cellulase/cellobiase CelA1